MSGLHMRFLYCIVLYIVFAFYVYGQLDQHDNTPCEPVMLKTVYMIDMCGKTLLVEDDRSVSMVLNKHQYHVLPVCLNCTVVLSSSIDQHAMVTLYKLGTEPGDDDDCRLNRLDVYDGDSVDSNNLISGDDGICGCKFPVKSMFQSTNNSLTLHFMTSCTHFQHGELQLVISGVKNDAYNITECLGEFECSDGQCIDKNLVCNDEKDCKDGSDETDCHVRNGTCPGMFECTDGACVNKNLVCNGVKNCPDGSDEIHCNHDNNVTCPGKFECSNGRCIDKNLVCNGHDDCSDSSDEAGCKGVSRRLLLDILIGVSAGVFILLLIVVIILCRRFCCPRVATVYMRFS